MNKTLAGGRASPRGGAVAIAKRRPLAGLLAALLVGAPPAFAQTWNAGTGDWFTAGNWNPAVVPGAGSSVIVSNGGTAQLNGTGTTPLLGDLNVGLGSSGTGSGAVQSAGVGIRVSGPINVGTIFSTGSFASGQVTVSGAGGQASSAIVGYIGSASSAAFASGFLMTENALTITNGLVMAGQMFDAARASTAQGTMIIGGSAGTASGLFIVGNVTALNSAQVGSRSTGSFSVLNGGGLTLAGGSDVYIGTTVGFDRAVEGSTTFVNRATGTAAIDGTLRVTGAVSGLQVGTTSGGVATGSLSVGALDVGANRVGFLSVGTAGNGGQATGSLTSGSGDLRVSGNAFVGSTSNGMAQGTVNLGSGQLLGDGPGALRAGMGFGGDAAVAVNARGTINAAGVSGFGNYSVGTLSGAMGAGSFAQGTVSGVGAGAASGSASFINVGVVSGTVNAVTANGSLTVDGSLLNNGQLAVAQMFEGGRGSSVQGALSIGGNAGNANGLFIVGNVTSLSAATVGSEATGTFSTHNGGGLTLTGGSDVYIGTTVGFDRAVEGSTTFVNRATGTVAIDGTLRVTGPVGGLRVGATDGGAASGALSVNALDMGANRIGVLNVGTTGTNGQAVGSLTSGSGNLNTNSNTSVGTTTGGNAQGSVNLGTGELRGNNGGTLYAGVGYGAGAGAVSARGEVNAAGVSGYSGYEVGMLSGAMGAGSFAQGVVSGAGAGVGSSTNYVTVGVAFNTVNAGTANGSLTVDGALLVNSGLIQVGQMFEAGRGSFAGGTLSIGGDAGAVSGLWIVGNVTSFSPATVGSQSVGAFSTSNGGGLSVQGGTGVYIGTTVGSDRAVEGGSTYVNRSTGAATIDGTLRVLGGGSNMWIGYTNSGEANGSLNVGSFDTGANRIETLAIGVAGSDGQATGELKSGGGNLNVSSLFVGIDNGGTAEGHLSVTDTLANIDRVLAGTGDSGTATMRLVDSTMNVAEDFSLFSGELSLDDSLLTVGGAFTLGEGATLRIDIDGIVRGAQYGAVNAGSAALDGVLAVDLTDLIFGDAMVFDLLRSGGLDGILGNFDNLLLTGLQTGYSAFAGIEVVDNVEVYRLRIARATVPEPGSVTLVLACFAGMMVAMRRQRVVVRA